MAIKTSELNAKLFGKTNKRHVSTPEQALSAAKAKTSVIELTVAGKATVSFELQTIPAQDITSKTVVFAENAREQAFLTETALADILQTLKQRGQQYPAVGRVMQDGTIEVLDGSRRRMSCILAKQDFLVYVGKDIDTEQAKFLSDVANAHKPLSLYEKGKEMQVKLDSGEVSDQKGLAEMFQCSEALVSGALKAAALPLELLQLYPSVTELGRPTIVKLHKAYSTLNDEQQKQLLQRVTSDTLVDEATLAVSNLAQSTKEVTAGIEKWMQELTPEKRSSSVTKNNLVRGRAQYVRKGNALTVNLKKIDDELSQEILDFIKQKLTE